MQQHTEATHPFPSSTSSSENADKINGANDASGSQIGERVEQAKHTVAKVLTSAEEQTVAIRDSVAHRIQRRPYSAVAIAALAGFALGLACMGTSRSSNDWNARSLRSRLHW
jgi:ElaB/YqjD/DUF883 family membrane-anchored ribosome-binding protein